MNSRNLFAKTLLLVGAPILYFLHPFRFYGVENLPRGEGLDAFYIALASRRNVHFMAKSELFRTPFFNWFFRSLNAFPVKRGHFDRKAIKTAVQIIKDGDVLGIFPEGGIVTRDGRPAKAKWGVAFIANECCCPVVPVSIYSKNGKGVFKRIILRFGEPIKFEELDLNDKTEKAGLEASADYIMQKIINQWEKGNEKG